MNYKGTFGATQCETVKITYFVHADVSINLCTPENFLEYASIIFRRKKYYIFIWLLYALVFQVYVDNYNPLSE